MNRYSSQKRVRTLVIRPDIATGYADLFGEKTVNGRSCSVEGLIVSLTRTIEADLARLLTARREFLAQITAGKRRYGFADPAEEVEDADGKRLTAAQVRQGMVDNLLGRDTPYRWRLNAKTPAPAEVRRPGLQGTGPADDLGMAMGAINAGRCGAVSWMWDWEDAGNDFQDKFYRAWRNLKEVLAGEWDGKTYSHPQKQKDYSIGVSRNEWPVIFHRVPGIHLRNRQIQASGRNVPGIIPALVFHTLNNFDAQKRNGSGIYFYIPKIETPGEALLVAKLLKSLEEAIGVPRGEIKVEMLNERARYAAKQELIMWVLRDWLIGPNVGRWDYINSRIEMLKDDPKGVFPDPHTVGMTDSTMTEYTRRNALLTLLVDGFPVGGMSAVIPCSPRMRPNVSAGVPVSGRQKGSLRDRSIVSRTSSAPFTSRGRRARRSLKSAPSSVTRLVTLTIRCVSTASTEPNCLVIQSRISAGGSSRPTVDDTSKMRSAAARASGGSAAIRSSSSAIDGRVSVFMPRAAPWPRRHTSRHTSSPKPSTSGLRASRGFAAAATGLRRRCSGAAPDRSRPRTRPPRTS